MKPQRRLHLRREALHSLDADALAGIVGGTHVRTDCGCPISHGDTCDACDVLSLPLNTCACYTFGMLAVCTFFSVTCP